MLMLINKLNFMGRIKILINYYIKIKKILILGNWKKLIKKLVI
jgi:hypothetical protein